MRELKPNNRIYLSLSTDDKKYWLDFYLKKRDKLRSELLEVDQNIAELRGNEPDREQLELPIDYDSTWSWPQKFDYILSNSASPLSVAEIVSKIEVLEGVKFDTEAKNRVNVALHYQAKAENGNLYKTDKEGKNLYGLKRWISKPNQTVKRLSELINDKK